MKKNESYELLEVSEMFNIDKAVEECYDFSESLELDFGYSESPEISFPDYYSLDMTDLIPSISEKAGEEVIKSDELMTGSSHSDSSGQPAKFGAEKITVMFPELLTEFRGISSANQHSSMVKIKETEYSDWVDLEFATDTSDLQQVKVLIGGIDEVNNELIKTGLRNKSSVQLCLLPGSGFETVRRLQLKKSKPQFTSEMYSYIRDRVVIIYDQMESASCLIVGSETLREISTERFLTAHEQPPINLNIIDVDTRTPEITRVVVLPGEMLEVIPTKLSAQLKYFEDEIF